MDELDALRYAAETRAILARAGRDDLADRAWAALCPPGVPIRVRHDALTQAGYPFKARRESRPGPETLQHLGQPAGRAGAP